MKFCSFKCENADNGKAQYAACLALNGVYCGLLHKVIEKGLPCQVPKIAVKNGKTKKKK
jgi:hypothetical protein